MQRADQAKLKFWQEHILRQQQSSLSITEYCRHSGISKDTFYSWRKKLRFEEPRPVKALAAGKFSSFAAVQVERDAQSAFLSCQDLQFDAKWLGNFAASFVRGLR